MDFRLPAVDRPWRSVIQLAALGFMLSIFAGCANVRLNAPRVPSYVISNGEKTMLGRAFERQAIEHPAMSGFQVVVSGQTAFMLRAALADAAERTLDLQYYSVGDDLTTDLLLLRIVGAAERGVRVRVLLDDVDASARLFAHRALAAHPDIQVRLFNPFRSGGTSSIGRLGEFILDGARLNRRMHNKLWMADSAAAVVGSRNLGDEYFDAKEGTNFSDVDLLAAGPILSELSSAFDAYWNSAAAVPIALVAHPNLAENARMLHALRTRAQNCRGVAPCDWLAEQDLVNALRSASVPLSWGRAQLTYDAPDQPKVGVPSGVEHGSIDDREGGFRTGSELLMVSPYFVPSAAGLHHLSDMRKRGVRVAVLTNSLASTDSPVAHAGYARYRTALLREGIELFEMRPQPDAEHRVSHRWRRASPASLHAKVIVQDRVRVIVGSVNQDPRSRLHNTETWITIESTQLAAELSALFDESVDAHHAFKVARSATATGEALHWTTEEHGSCVRYDTEPMATPWMLLWRSLLGIVVPEHML